MGESADTIKTAIHGNEVTFAWRVRFPIGPASVALARDLRANGKKQILFEHPKSPERLEVWPLGDSEAILERTVICAFAEAPDVRAAHLMYLQAYLAVMSSSHGAAEAVSVSDFEETDPKQAVK